MPAASAKACSSSRVWSLTRCAHSRSLNHQRGSSISTATATYDHTMSAPEVELRAAWRQLVGNANEPRLDQLLDQLLASHREEHRHYHTATHVMWVLRHIAHMLAAGEQATDAAAIRLAALYHDAVYDPSATDNEARSARLAGEAGAALGWPAARRQVVQRLVEATAAHQPRDRDEAVLIDADLAILGASPNDYAAYALGVRAEYAHVPGRQRAHCGRWPQCDQCAQAQPPPQPPAGFAAAAGDGEAAAPTLANTDSRRTAPSWPCGHVAGSLDSLIGRRTSKVSSQVRQRNS